MSWSRTLTINDYEITFISEGAPISGVIISAGADLDDPDYLDALQQAQGLFPFLEIFSYLDEAHDLWHQRHTREYVDRAGAIDKAWQFLSQDELTKPDWIREFIEDLKNKTPVFEKEARGTVTKKRDGYVYLLKQVGGEHYKIGRTKTPADRIKTFGVRLPFEVDFVCLISTEDMYRLENELHEKFAHRRGDGEWFILTPDDVGYIRGLAS